MTRPEFWMEPKRKKYVLAGRNYTQEAGAQTFLPRKGGEIVLNTGYISEETADEKGNFPKNPTVAITLEAAFKCFGLTLEFGRNAPECVVFHSYYDGKLQEDYQMTDLQEITVVSHEFPAFDQAVLEFTEGSPGNRVILDNVRFGDSTDYSLEYGTELTKMLEGDAADQGSGAAGHSYLFWGERGRKGACQRKRFVLHQRNRSIPFTCLILPTVFLLSLRSRQKGRASPLQTAALIM